MSTPGVSLVVNTYENPFALARVFAALRMQTRSPREIVVADDGSGDETRRLVVAQKGEFKIPVLHCWQKNEGFRRAKILNQAIAQSTGNYLVFLDGDSVPQRRFIEDHERLLERGYWMQGRRAFIKENAVREFEPDYSCVLRYILAGKMTGVAKGIRMPFPVVKRDQSQKGILGCNLGIWRDDLIEVNGYDEMFVGWGKEDSELANRLYNIGRKRKLVHNWAVIYHLDHPIAPRSGLEHNQKLLDQTIALKRTRCQLGLSQYL